MKCETFYFFILFKFLPLIFTHIFGLKNSYGFLTDQNISTSTLTKKKSQSPHYQTGLFSRQNTEEVATSSNNTYMPQLNSRGVPLKSLDNSLDFSLERPFFNSQLKTKKTLNDDSTGEINSLILTTGAIQGGQIQKNFSFKNYSFYFEGLTKRDNRYSYYLDHKQTPYNTSDDTWEKIEGQKYHHYFLLSSEIQSLSKFNFSPQNNLQNDDDPIKVSLSFDESYQNPYPSLSLVTLNGATLKKKRWEFTGIHRYFGFFWMGQNSQFSPINQNENSTPRNPFSSNILQSKMENSKIGFNFYYPQPFISKLKIYGLLYEENLKSQSSLPTHLHFKRNLIQLEAQYKNSLQEIVLLGDLSQDKSKKNNEKKQQLTGSTIHFKFFKIFEPFNEFVILPIETEFQFFQERPSVIDNFGDGGFLLPAHSPLPFHQGIKLKLGPKYYFSLLDLVKGDSSIYYFFEESQNSPIQISTGTNAVRTFPIGGLWAQGLQGEINLQDIYFLSDPQSKISLIGTFQDARLKNKINWQYGNKVPGRPDWQYTLKTKIPILKDFFWNTYYHFQGISMGNMANTIKRNKTLTLDMNLTWSTQDFSITLSGENLLYKQKNLLTTTDANSNNNQLATSLAAPNLLDDGQYADSYKLILEIPI
jgi:hypothetical protein